MEPNLGFYLWLPVVMILLALSGGTVLLTDFQQTKRLIFLSWGSYLLPAIIGVVNLIQIYPIYFWAFDQHGMIFPLPLGFYPLYTHLFLQLSLLLNRQSFKDWSGFYFTKDETSQPLIARYSRLLRSFIFVIAYVGVWGGPPIILMFHLE